MPLQVLKLAHTGLVVGSIRLICHVPDWAYCQVKLESPTLETSLQSGDMFRACGNCLGLAGIWLLQLLLP